MNDTDIFVVIAVIISLIMFVSVLVLVRDKH